MMNAHSYNWQPWLVIARLLSARALRCEENSAGNGGT